MLLIAAANLIGGFTYLGQKEALEVFSPGWVTLGRHSLALLAMFVLIRMRGGIKGQYARADWRRLALAGLLGYAAPLLLGNIGLRWSTAGNASILILLEPAAILVFSVALLGETITRSQIIGVGFGIAGALFIVLDGIEGVSLLEGGLLLGNVLLVVHALLWGVYSPLIKPLAGRFSSLELTFLSMTFGLALLVPAALVEGWPRAAPEGDLAAGLAWVLGLGLVGSFLATLWWNASLKVLPAAMVAPFVLLQPLAGVLGDWLVRGVTPGRAGLAGGALIVIGLFCVLLQRPAKIPRVQPE